MNLLKNSKRCDVKTAIADLASFSLYGGQRGRNWQMPGDGRYQPEDLKPFLGYDQWAGWLIIVEWFWLVTLAKIGVMPFGDSLLLKDELLFTMLRNITTTKQDKREAKTKHDIIALLIEMRKYLPQPLHKWLHLCATSYDIICTAYALQLKTAFNWVILPKMKEVDDVWRRRIEENIGIIQAGRTHLQTALPVTVGFWLSCLHRRFIGSCRNACELFKKIPGKFSGAVGTSASQRVFIKSKQAETVLMKMLGLPKAEGSTQIAPPEATARYYFELVLLSGIMGNLGEDIRILQSSQFGEILSASSSSSAMPHKKANPIAAENDAGMHVSVIAENMKVVLTLISELQRDLRWSNVMRSYSAVAVYAYQQLLTTQKLLNSLKIDKRQCARNFNKSAKLVVAELLHLSLQMNEFPNTHHFVNKVIVPAAAKSRRNLAEEMEKAVKKRIRNKSLQRAWTNTSGKVRKRLKCPKKYLGDAIYVALKEVKNKL